MKHLLKNSVLIAAILGTFPITAQAITKIHKDNPQFEQLIKKSIEAQEFSLFGRSVSTADRLLPTASFKTASGEVKTRYTQYYQGIPVWGESIVAKRTANNQLNDISGTFIQGIDRDLSENEAIHPEKQIAPQEALEIAKQRVIIKQYKEVQSIKTEREEVERFIYPDSNGKARYVYVISFIINEPSFSRPFMIIEAKTGEILEEWDGMARMEATGPGGNGKTGRYQFGVDFGPLIVANDCKMETSDVITYNMKHQTTGGDVHKLTDCGRQINAENGDADFKGAYSPINDAHYFTHEVLKMYKTWYNERPVTGRVKLRLYFGQPIDARWDGDTITFGDGYAGIYPATTHDIIAHELGHGFTESNAKLVYKGQSGAITESFADMSGVAFLEYLYGSYDLTKGIGGTVMVDPNKVIRYFHEPTLDGVSIDHVRDYQENRDVHHLAGVYNKAFYHLATTTGWSIRKAFEIFLIANKIYWNQQTGFESGAIGVCRAALDKGYNSEDVITAFQQVGLQISCGDTTWIATQAYATGDEVLYEGKTYRAKWSNTGQTPGSGWGPWEEVVPLPVQDCSAYPVWDNTTVYTNDKIQFEGMLYQSKWWHQNKNPKENSSGGVWELIASCAP